MPGSLQAAGAIAQAYRFTPEGQQFLLPVEVFIFVPNSALTGVDPADLTLLATTATGFEQLTGITVDIGADGITVRPYIPLQRDRRRGRGRRAAAQPRAARQCRRIRTGPWEPR